MRSMTGFGRAEGFRKDLQCGFKAELSSINKKQLELKFSIPKELAPQEMALRAFLAEKLVRGAVTLRIESLSCGDSGLLKTDFSRAEILLEGAREFQKKHNLPGEITISDLLSIPDAFAIQSADLENPEIIAFLFETVGNALEELLKLKESEGANLKQDILSRIDRMEQIVGEIEPLAAPLPELQKQKLYKKLKDLDLLSDVNDDRLLREAVIYGDKLDVSEEITRLHSHFANFRKISSESGAVGRSLDFLVQEIFRECNTLGNKVPSTEISPKVVQLKTELEKIREQVQNIE